MATATPTLTTHLALCALRHLGTQPYAVYIPTVQEGDVIVSLSSPEAPAASIATSWAKTACLNLDDDNAQSLPLCTEDFAAEVTSAGVNLKRLHSLRPIKDKDGGQVYNRDGSQKTKKIFSRLSIPMSLVDDYLAGSSKTPTSNTKRGRRPKSTPPTPVVTPEPSTNGQTELVTPTV